MTHISIGENYSNVDSLSEFPIKNISNTATTTGILAGGSNPTVDTLVDENDGDFSAGDVSLREAIAQGKAGDTINFAPNLAGGTIILTEGELPLDKSLTINGLGADKLTVSGNNASRIFNISGSGTTVTIDNLTLSNGKANVGGCILTGADSTLILNNGSIVSNSAINGGGIFNAGGSLTITASTILNNTASGAGGGGIANTSKGNVSLLSTTISGNSAQQGGGIENFGQTVALVNSTISGNSANFGGGIDNGSTSTVTLANSTISGNSAVNSGGGISNNGTAILLNSTIANNSAKFGGGVENSLQTVQISNTIIANNTAEMGADVRGNFNDQGNNLIGNTTGSSGFTNSLLVGTSTAPLDPNLEPLQNNGGATWTHALRADSPGINAGDNNTTSVTIDQRGYLRVVDSKVDIGAFERENISGGVDPNPPVVQPVAPKPFVLEPVTGKGGQKPFVVRRSEAITIDDFGGLGRGNRPLDQAIAELDTLKFEGAGLTARNMRLRQRSQDLEITFEGVADTAVRLRNFKLEDLENQGTSKGAPTRRGNIVFNGQQVSQDNFDVFDANSTQKSVLKRNSVTFLNDRNNTVSGLDNSNDVINGQQGRDTIKGRRGNDLLRGGEGKDRVMGDDGQDILVGGEGRDVLTGGKGRDKFIYQSVSDRGDKITDFEASRDRLVLTPVLDSLGYSGNKPIKVGLLQLVQSGASTKVQIDSDERLDVTRFVTLTTLQNVDANQLVIRKNVVI